MTVYTCALERPMPVQAAFFRCKEGKTASGTAVAPLLTAVLLANVRRNGKGGARGNTHAVDGCGRFLDGASLFAALN